jgi:radical SAM protein with 4Fe4S-binding SPASM domain
MTIQSKNIEWLRKRLNQKLSNRRVPVTGTFELTWSCNFRCSHCYLKGWKKPGRTELKTAEVKTILDQLADLGCLSISLTGGEPLCRQDFEQIYSYAVRLGFLVSVFTNASMIDQRVADIFSHYPPRSVEVSIYGGDPESYEATTGSGKNFEKMQNGVSHLLRRDIEVVPKAVLFAPLVGQIEKIRQLVDGWGLDIRFDPAVDPTLTRDYCPVSMRLDPREAVEIELYEKSRLNKLIKYDQERQRHHSNSSFEYACNAGFSSFHIDPTGHLMPCLLFRRPEIDIISKGFSAGWELLGDSSRPKFDAELPCNDCDIQHLCTFCPGLANLGDVPSADGRGFHCQVAKARASLIRADYQGQIGETA